MTGSTIPHLRYAQIYQSSDGPEIRLLGILFREFHGVQDLEEIVVVIGPDAEMRRNENGLDDDRGVEVIQETGVSRDQGPVGGVDQLAAIVAVADQAKRIPCVACEQLDHRGEVQIGVRRVNHEYSARFEVAHVESEGLFG